MTPVLLLWTARGVTALEDWIWQTSTMIGQKKAPMRRWVLWLPGILLSIPLLALLVAKPIKARMLVQYPVEYRAAGNWIEVQREAEEGTVEL